MPRLHVILILLFVRWSDLCGALQHRHRHHRHRLGLSASASAPATAGLIPTPVALKATNIEIVRFLGKIDVIEGGQQQTQASSPSPCVRIFEARVQTSALIGEDAMPSPSEATSLPSTVRCFLKEYLTDGDAYGKREMACSLRLLSQWNKNLQSAPGSEDGADGDTFGESDGSGSGGDGGKTRGPDFVPFTVLLGTLRTDARIENPEFRTRWLQRFPRTRPPEANNLWLIYEWDKASFKTLKTFPALPQIVEGLDYFNKRERSRKRWEYIRRVMRRGLESADFLHRAGHCHNALSADSIWLSTTNQKETARLDIRLADLGASQKLSDLGPYARGAVFDDFYQLGLVFLELIVNSFSEDDKAALIARQKYASSISRSPSPSSSSSPDGEKAQTMSASFASFSGSVETLGSNLLIGLGAPPPGLLKGPLLQREWQALFESECDSDFSRLRSLTREVCPEGSDLLEQEQGAAWRLLFRLLARGRLVDPADGKPLSITGRGLLREFKELLSV